MRKLTGCAILVCAFLFCTQNAMAQDSTVVIAKNTKVQKYTVMEQFEPGLMMTAEERKKMKEERLRKIKLTARILDTMDISDRKREKLLKDLIKTPYSDRLNKALADIKFEDIDE